MYKTDDLQKELLDYLNDNKMAIKPLKSKDDLTKTGTKPLSYIQFISNTYQDGKLHTFKANFNLYFVDKTLSNGTKSELLELLDIARGLLAGARVEMLPYVKKENPVIITRETFTETKSSVFVYVMNISIKVGIPNENSKNTN